MKTDLKPLHLFPVIALGAVLFSSFLYFPKEKPSFPYKQAGLTERQAAAHLLNRFTYGATPGQIDAVVKTGLENWFYQQLSGDLPDQQLDQRLSAYDAINLSNEEVVRTYPRANQVINLAVQAGAISREAAVKQDDPKYREQVQQLMQKMGMKPQQELFRQFFNQKVLRATYTNNQFREVMTDFWFNHFNVSFTKNDCAPFIPAYERDVIRPNVFGKFENILVATAKSPAMLYFLDNFNSSGPADQRPGTQQQELRKRLIMQAQAQGVMADSMNAPALRQVQQAKRNQGLNENYAREVMELHTLGVDGGYTQQDVTQAAKILTGWTVYPLNNRGAAGIMQRPGVQNQLAKQGNIREGDFMFASNRHDHSEKTVLGKKFPANGGYEEGKQLLDLLAHHPSTAKFISRKIAIRFVNDNPSQKLIDRMAKTFTDKDGDIREVLLTMVASPEFWSREALREKTKSPFELAISSVRALDADVRQPNQLFTWVTRMGQKMYYYQAPTGFPDKGQYWINTGSLLNRMNFGLALASQRIPGVVFDLKALNNNHEPESASAALLTYSNYLLPERDIAETVKRLTPLMNDPGLEKKIDEAAGKNAPASQQETPDMQQTGTMMDDMQAAGTETRQARAKTKPVAKAAGGKKAAATVQYAAGNNTMLAQVVGVIVGSPEFQRK